MGKKILILISAIMMFFALSYANENQDFACQDKGKKNVVTKKRISKRYKTKEEKFEAAKRYYEQGAYLSATQLFEELYPLYVAEPEGDTILFLFADSYMKNNDFLMAAYHFKDYVKRYPLSPNVEQASFLAAKCYYLNSPDYNVDQTDSKMAIESLQIFVNTYPTGKYVEQSNAMIDTLRNKLAKKDFSVGQMYYNTENYKAAQICLENLLKDYPESSYTEEALFYLVKNSQKYAQNSVESKKLERYQMVIDYTNKLRAKNDQSKFLPEAERIAADALKKRNKLLNN